MQPPENKSLKEVDSQASLEDPSRVMFLQTQVWKHSSSKPWKKPQIFCSFQQLLGPLLVFLRLWQTTSWSSSKNMHQQNPPRFTSQDCRLSVVHYSDWIQHCFIYDTLLGCTIHRIWFSSSHSDCPKKKSCTPQLGILEILEMFHVSFSSSSAKKVCKKSPPFPFSRMSDMNTKRRLTRRIGP